MGKLSRWRQEHHEALSRPVQRIIDNKAAEVKVVTPQRVEPRRTASMTFQDVDVKVKATNLKSLQESELIFSEPTLVSTPIKQDLPSLHGTVKNNRFLKEDKDKSGSQPDLSASKNFTFLTDNTFYYTSSESTPSAIYSTPYADYKPSQTFVSSAVKLSGLSPQPRPQESVTVNTAAASLPVIVTTPPINESSPTLEGKKKHVVKKTHKVTHKKSHRFGNAPDLLRDVEGIQHEPAEQPQNQIVKYNRSTEETNSSPLEPTPEATTTSPDGKKPRKVTKVTKKTTTTTKTIKKMLPSKPVDYDDSPQEMDSYPAIDYPDEPMSESSEPVPDYEPEEVLSRTPRTPPPDYDKNLSVFDKSSDEPVHYASLEGVRSPVHHMRKVQRSQSAREESRSFPYRPRNSDVQFPSPYQPEIYDDMSASQPSLVLKHPLLSRESYEVTQSSPNLNNSELVRRSSSSRHEMTTISESNEARPHIRGTHVHRQDSVASSSPDIPQYRTMPGRRFHGDSITSSSPDIARYGHRHHNSSSQPDLSNISPRHVGAARNRHPYKQRVTKRNSPSAVLARANFWDSRVQQQQVSDKDVNVQEFPEMNPSYQ